MSLLVNIMRLMILFLGTMFIDHDSAKNLEICGNNASKKTKHSLFG